jgi:hypothetical protein
MKEVELDARGSINHKRVFFLDLIESGLNVEFVITQFLHSYATMNKNPPEIYVMPLAVGIEKYLKIPKFIGNFLEIDVLVKQVSRTDREEMEHLIRTIDGLDSYSSFRITPNFSADFWHEWHVNPRIRPIYNNGKTILDNINTSLKKDWNLTERNKTVY